MHHKDWYNPWDSDHCVRYNDAYGQQSAEPQKFKASSSAWSSNF